MFCCVEEVSDHQTCEVIEAVVLKDLVQDAEELPHLRGDGLTGEAKGQRQDLLVKLWEENKQAQPSGLVGAASGWRSRDQPWRGHWGQRRRRWSALVNIS